MEPSYSEKMIFNMASVRHLEFRYFGISEFLSRFRRLAQYCVRIPDFVKFGRFAAEIWSYNYFQNGGRPPCWIFEI